ncbi:hypothetical protein RvY_03850-2 [Ramazzottius varieornatus]|uniref:Uncharacterized protein n=1 Tax=Ramazzottius varieornatus TaxID=947166 RepID=A0A1D1UPH1_RAMVA|nr:hypothetical protein RvY_03850-2 [Ramazzottius varieornatus]
MLGAVARCCCWSEVPVVKNATGTLHRSSLLFCVFPHCDQCCSKSAWCTRHTRFSVHQPIHNPANSCCIIFPSARLSYRHPGRRVFRCIRSLSTLNSLQGPNMRRGEAESVRRSNPRYYGTG